MKSARCRGTAVCQYVYTCRETQCYSRRTSAACQLAYTCTGPTPTQIRPHAKTAAHWGESVVEMTTFAPWQVIPEVPQEGVS